MYIRKLKMCDGLSVDERMAVAHDEIKTLYDTRKDNSIGNISRLTGLHANLVEKVVKDYTRVKDAYCID